MEVIDLVGIDAIIVAFDRTSNYRKLNTAYQALLRGARFLDTNPDRMCPMPGGGIPDAGDPIAALEAISGRTFEVLTGKPTPIMMEITLAQLGLAAVEWNMVGDRLTTDFEMGWALGMRTEVVLTGEATLEECQAANPGPQYIAENFQVFLQQLSGSLQGRR